MSESKTDGVSLGDETMKAVGELSRQTEILKHTENEVVISREDAQSWIGFIVKTVLSIFGK